MLTLAGRRRESPAAIVGNGIGGGVGGPIGQTPALGSLLLTMGIEIEIENGRWWCCLALGIGTGVVGFFNGSELFFGYRVPIQLCRWLFSFVFPNFRTHCPSHSLSMIMMKCALISQLIVINFLLHEQCTCTMYYTCIFNFFNILKEPGNWKRRGARQFKIKNYEVWILIGSFYYQVS